MVAQFFIVFCLVTAAVSITYAAYEAVRSWLDEKNQVLIQYQRKVSEHFQNMSVAMQHLEEENDTLRQDLRAAMSRELDWITERKRLVARNTLMAQELSLDDANKLTQIITR